jgi:hypothetical protein
MYIAVPTPLTKLPSFVILGAISVVDVFPKAVMPEAPEVDCNTRVNNLPSILEVPLGIVTDALTPPVLVVTLILA